jgi:hypothetical protein
MYLDMSDMASLLPQKLAWQRIQSEVTNLFLNRLLDESTSPVLLQEQIWRVLLYEPGSWVRDHHKPRTRFWQLLGFESIDAVQGSAIEELAARATRLLAEYQAQVSEAIDPSELSEYQRWCRVQARWLRRLCYWLDLLGSIQKHFEPPMFELNELFEYLDTRDVASAVPVVRALIPSILNSYQTLLLRNFSQLVDRFAFYRLRDASLLVQVIWNVPDWDYTDNLALVYVLLPSVDLPEKCLVYAPEPEDSVISLEMHRETIMGSETAYGAYFGRARVSLRVEDHVIEEPDAFLCRTIFPSHHPVRDQAYQLLSHEAGYLMHTDFTTPDISHRNTDEHLDWWIARHLLTQKAKQ